MLCYSDLTCHIHDSYNSIRTAFRKVLPFLLSALKALKCNAGHAKQNVLARDVLYIFGWGQKNVHDFLPVWTVKNTNMLQIKLRCDRLIMTGTALLFYLFVYLLFCGPLETYRNIDKDDRGRLLRLSWHFINCDTLNILYKTINSTTRS